MDSSDEEMYLFQILFEEEQRRKKKRRTHKYWVHEICQKRDIYGEFHHLFPDLKKDPKKCFEYFRMTYEKFQELLDIIGIAKQMTKYRKPIQPAERLAVSLRYKIDVFD